MASIPTTGDEVRRADFRCNNGFGKASGQRPSEHLFRVRIIVITLGSIEKVDPLVESCMDRGYRHIVVLRAPDFAAGEGPASKCKFRHVYSGFSQRFVVHGWLFQGAMVTKRC